MYTIEFYSRKRFLHERQWYWRARHINGQVVAWSGEGYFNRRDCQSSWSRFAMRIASHEFDIKEL